LRRSSGFTILEIIVVLLLLSILAATLLGRSITNSTIDLNSATDKIRNQLRFAQAEAMKRAYEAYPVWGVKSAGTQYWMFRGMTPDLSANEVRVPGGDYPGVSNRINKADIGVTVSDFTIFFDLIGKPYTAYNSYTDPNANAPLATPMQINITASTGPPITIIITPETGLIR
jgi:prepilin-type N-terminal cleavage/methylation domain-containing protein